MRASFEALVVFFKLRVYKDRKDSLGEELPSSYPFSSSTRCSFPWGGERQAVGRQAVGTPGLAWLLFTLGEDDYYGPV
jgi:hypothetical protein